METEPDPIEQITTDLKAWVTGTLSNSEDISLAPPGKTEKVSVYLMAVAQGTRRVGGRQMLKTPFYLRYLVTVGLAQSEQAKNAQSSLIKLLFAAMDSTKFEVESQALSPEAWSAFQVPPQPHFILRIPLFYQPPEVEVGPPVTQPLQIAATLSIRAAGQLRESHTGIPLVGALVEIPSLGLKQLTDVNGQFVFAAFPAAVSEVAAEIGFKGHRFAEKLKIKAGVIDLVSRKIPPPPEEP